MILLHESAYYIKRYDVNETSISIVKTLEEFKDEFIDEGGKLFMKYLFNHPIIGVISSTQAIELFKEENWDNLELLHNIFLVLSPKHSNNSITYMYVKNQNSGCHHHPKKTYPH